MLTKEEFGTYELINTLVLMLIPIITFQLPMATFRFLINCRDENSEDKKRKIISSSCIFIGITSFISLIIVYFFLPNIDFHIKILICLFLLLDIIVELTKQIARGLGDIKTFSFSTAIHAITNVIFVVILLSFMNMGLSGLLISLNIAMACTILFILIRTKIVKYINIRSFDKALLKEFFKYSIPLIPNAVSLHVINAAGRIITAAYMGLEATAIYAVANRIPQLLGQVYGVFGLSWHENASETCDAKDSEKYYSNVFNNLFNLLSGFTAVLIAATPIIFIILVRGDYDEAYFQIPILYLGVFFHCLMGFFGGIYVAVKKTLAVGISSVISAAFSIAVNFIFIEQIGLYAASISMLVGFAGIFVFRLIHTRKWKKIEYKWTKNILCFIAILIVIAIYYQKSLVFDVINITLSIIFACFINKNIIIAIFKKGTSIIKKHLKKSP